MTGMREPIPRGARHRWTTLVLGAAIGAMIGGLLFFPWCTEHFGPGGRVPHYWQCRSILGLSFNTALFPTDVSATAFPVAEVVLLAFLGAILGTLLALICLGL